MELLDKLLADAAWQLSSASGGGKAEESLDVVSLAAALRRQAAELAEQIALQGGSEADSFDSFSAALQVLTAETKRLETRLSGGRSGGGRSAAAAAAPSRPLPAGLPPGPPPASRSRSAGAALRTSAGGAAAAASLAPGCSPPQARWTAAGSSKEQPAAAYGARRRRSDEELLDIIRKSSDAADAAALVTTGDCVTKAFHVPRCRHHLVVGKGGQRISQLQEAHRVTIRVPRAEDTAADAAGAHAVAVSGRPDDVESCRLSLEALLVLPVGVEPLHALTLRVPKARHGTIIGPGGKVLQSLMSECRVVISVPKSDDVCGDVTVQGRYEDCDEVRRRIEALVRDTVQVVESAGGAAPRIPWPPSYDLQTRRPIRKCLFFPEDEGRGSGTSEDGLGALETFLKFLDSPRQTCDVCVFTITDDRISRRLLDAHQLRGVKVRVITDREQSTSLGSDVREFSEKGIEVRMNTTPYHMHHKFCLLDGKVLVNGSFNWTQGACENNSENVMITNDEAFVGEFRLHFESLWRECATLVK
eukprot:TRINITY_DN105035_c0_g1_i1.p1 TRINITY_DN105035_c0_g1~~TRINITY_DN105035_c0_g1_i1.p1  ORF type:complete len:531 (-),score=132.86 TRINITY_DN105035_c0_g1_i1:102-1694(-)